MQCTTEKNASAEEMVAFLKTGRMTPLLLVESFVALFYRLKKFLCTYFEGSEIN